VAMLRQARLKTVPRSALTDYEIVCEKPFSKMYLYLQSSAMDGLTKLDPDWSLEIGQIRLR
jgi:hypothetical protein